MKIVLISADESKVGMGVRTLSSCLRKKGFDTVIVIMANLESAYKDFNWNELFDLCKESSLIGISFMTHAVKKAIDIKNRLSAVTSVPIVAGGIHATLDPDSLLKNFNYVCHGEGEDLIAEMAEKLETGKSIIDIPGLWLKQKETVIKNRAIPLSMDIGSYPFPDYEMNHQYVLDGSSLAPIQPIPMHMSIEDFVILGSRGCPHHCTYCSNMKIKSDFPWRKKVFNYSVDYLIDNMKEVKLLFPSVKSFWIEDDTFFIKDLSEIKYFAGRYKEEISLPFKILISPWTYCKEKLDPLINAGMDKLIMGIQSGCERVNKNIYARNISNNRLLQITAELHTYHKLLKCYDFIGMNPFETAEDLIETVRFILRIPVPFFIFSNNLAFYPGTELSNKAICSGIETSRRVKHSESNIGYGIILHEKLDHKIFHLILLLMSGKATQSRFGAVPRFILSDAALKLYENLNRKYPRLWNGIAISVAFACNNLNWRKFVKMTFSPATISSVRHFLAKIKR
ncbi:MAG: radical SAM protein [Lentisphaerota bacterium]